MFSIDSSLTKPESPTAFPSPVLDASSLNTPSLFLHTQPQTHFQHIKELTLNHALTNHVWV